jgi:hypothetical protein
MNERILSNAVCPIELAAKASINILLPWYLVTGTIEHVPDIVTRLFPIDQLLQRCVLLFHATELLDFSFGSSG